MAMPVYLNGYVISLPIVRVYSHPSAINYNLQHCDVMHEVAS